MNAFLLRISLRSIVSIVWLLITFSLGSVCSAKNINEYYVKVGFETGSCAEYYLSSLRSDDNVVHMDSLSPATVHANKTSPAFRVNLGNKASHEYDHSIKFDFNINQDPLGHIGSETLTVYTKFDGTCSNGEPRFYLISGKITTGIVLGLEYYYPAKESRHFCAHETITIYILPLDPNCGDTTKIHH